MRKIFLCLVFIVIPIACAESTRNLSEIGAPKTDININLSNQRRGNDRSKNISADNIFDEFIDENISCERRDQIVEELKSRRFEEVAEKLIEIMISYRPMFAYNIPEEKPWMSNSYPTRVKIWLAAGVVWHEHTGGKKDPEKEMCIISLLKSRKDNAVRIKLLEALGRQWGDSAETEALNITKNKNEDLYLRRRSIALLLWHSEINKYLTDAIEIIKEYKGKKRIDVYCDIMNVGNRLFLLSNDNKGTLIKLGFQILQEECGEKPACGYFLARQLGFILKMPDEFAPDQNLQKYKGKNGLNDEFFEDTVKNALEWYKNK